MTSQYSISDRHPISRAEKILELFCPDAATVARENPKAYYEYTKTLAMAVGSCIWIAAIMILNPLAMFTKFISTLVLLFNMLRIGNVRSKQEGFGSRLSWKTTALEYFLLFSLQYYERSIYSVIRTVLYSQKMIFEHGTQGIPLAALMSIISVVCKFCDPIQGPVITLGCSQAFILSMECIVWQIGIAGVANACSVNTISLIHREMAMRKFIGDKITHDLQSAVTGVVGAWDVVAAVPNEKLAAESIDLVKLSIDTAKASVEDFVVALRLAIGSIQLHASAVKLMPCLKDILDEVGHVAQYKRIDIHFSSSCPDSVCIQLDSVRLKQIITNLVFNSIKFTHTYGSIFVYAEVLRTGLRKGILDQVLVRVVIEDNGFGFDHQRLPSLTDGANKTEYSTERRLEGAGIGMWLINDIATEALGGRLRVSRRRGGSGNKFVLEIPTSEIVEYEPTRVLAQDINALRSNILQGARILVIEDDEVAAVVIKSMLIRLGARPEVAFGSSVSLRELEDTLTRNFDAAICGLDVPSLDPYHILSAIQRRKIKVIGITSMLVDEAKMELYGINVVMTKPISVVSMAMALQHIIPREGPGATQQSSPTMEEGVNIIQSFVQKISANEPPPELHS